MSQVIEAHKASSRNRDTVLRSEVCGCFYCCRILKPAEVTQWTINDTAICPYCWVDSVLGSASGYPVTPEFLKAMAGYWFKT